MSFLCVEVFDIVPRKRCKYTCDQCTKVFYRKYRKRMTTNSHPWFCSVYCSALWKYESNITTKNLFSKESRIKAAIKNKTNGSKLAAKLRNICMDKFGVANISQLESVKEKKRSSCLKHYGVDHHWKSHVVRQQIHEFMKKNNKYKHVSKGELQLLSMLGAIFGKENIEHHTIVNFHEIDFYIKTIDTYIQFDGIYWHGLDRPRHIIESSSNNRDKCILKTMDIDQKQNQWFHENNKKLLRITDKQLEMYNKSKNIGNRLSILFDGIVMKTGVNA